MAKHSQATKDFKQKHYQDIRVKYGCGVCLQQGGEAVVLDKVGAKKLIKELSSWIDSK
ncbi:hypothetical protein BRC2024_KCUCJSVR_CDS_0064 [Acinetobacter phage vB_AbaM_KissB]|uniref:hypothetical protein n=1 Tax=Acinetobacter phage vB_AbaM_phiAbaA1 TaxID=1605379 RepID=UPI00078DEE43|nr:hypothetical protein BJD49_gp070 [Acinetobacter phage vB_AbaM_phiAbaA1]AJK27220.1 hypothetical protein phiAbaA1_117 [Acinetobacter phage vB_AbaM_phiAbaA1]